jgi:hypothetical protein
MNEITRVLDDIHAGKAGAADLLPLVYAQLRDLAASKLAREQPGHALDATCFFCSPRTVAGSSRFCGLRGVSAARNSFRSMSGFVPARFCLECVRKLHTVGEFSDAST